MQKKFVEGPGPAKRVLSEKKVASPKKSFYLHSKTGQWPGNAIPRAWYSYLKKRFYRPARLASEGISQGRLKDLARGYTSY